MPEGTASLPAGTIVAFAGAPNRISEGWLPCDGRELNGEDPRYARLYSAIGTAWGTPGVPRFYLPDLRGRFLRGVSDATGNDPHAGERTALRPGGNTGDNFATYQADAIQRHDHPVGPLHVGHTVNGNNGVHRIDSDDGPSWNNFDMVLVAESRPDWAHETRPKNAAVFYIIKT